MYGYSAIAERKTYTHDVEQLEVEYIIRLEAYNTV